MKKAVAKKLKIYAKEFGKRFSNKKRKKNYAGETFHVVHINPRSDTVATVTYRKEPGDKLGMAIMLYINSQGGYWWGFFPKDSHLLGLKNMKKPSG